MTNTSSTSSTYTTPAQDAATIRAALKAKHGWTSKQVSVRSESYSMGSSVRVEIKDPTIPFATVEAIAKGAERIRYCSHTGEILGGGNRFVSVNYSHEASLAFEAKWLAAVEATIAAVTPGSNFLEPVAGTPFLVGRQSEWRTALWGSEGHICEGNANALARTVGRLMVERAGKE